MKKVLLILLTFLLVAGFDFTTDQTANFPWEDTGEITALESASPSVTQREYSAFVAQATQSVIFTLSPYRWNTIGFRFAVDGEGAAADDGNAYTMDFYASKGEDNFTPFATFSVTGGQQTAPATTASSTLDMVFADTINSMASETWITDITSVDDTGRDNIASIWFNLNGFDTIAVVPTNASATVCNIYTTGY
jgi:hypothetical protein